MHIPCREQELVDAFHDTLQEHFGEAPIRAGQVFNDEITDLVRGTLRRNNSELTAA